MGRGPCGTPGHKCSVHKATERTITLHCHGDGSGLACGLGKEVLAVVLVEMSTQGNGPPLLGDSNLVRATWGLGCYLRAGSGLCCAVPWRLRLCSTLPRLLAVHKVFLFSVASFSAHQEIPGHVRRPYCAVWSGGHCYTEDFPLGLRANAPARSLFGSRLGRGSKFHSIYLKGGVA